MFAYGFEYFKNILNEFLDIFLWIRILLSYKFENLFYFEYVNNYLNLNSTPYKFETLKDVYYISNMYFDYFLKKI